MIDAGSSGSRVQVYSWLDPDLARKERQKEGKNVDVLSKVEKGVEEGDGWHFKVEPGKPRVRPQSVSLSGGLSPN